LFHLKKNLWETVGKKHALKLYNTNSEFQFIVDLMAALSYTRADLVVPFFDEAIEPLIEDLPDDLEEAGYTYIDYVTNTYIGRRAGRAATRRSPLFRAEMWSAFDDLLNESPATNNALEAWNGQLNAAKLRSDNLWSLILNLQREDSLAYDRYLQELATVINPELSPDEGRQRKVLHREKMAKLKNLAEQIDDMDPLEYLSSVSAIIKKNNFKKV